MTALTDGGVDDDAKYQKKYMETKKEVDHLEDTNAQLILKINRAKKVLQRLKFERKLLFEKLESLDTNDNSQAATAKTLLNHHSSLGGISEEEDSGEETDVLSITAADEPKKKKKKRDPNAPKRPANAFFMYCQLEREQVRSENPEITRAELTKVLGTKWKSMTEDEKKKYYELYEKDKERYASEMKEYEASGTAAVPVKKDEESVSVVDIETEEITMEE